MTKAAFHLTRDARRCRDRSPKLCAAFDAGERTAKGYKVGDQFLGASPEADRQGFGDDKLARAVFISAYINNLASPIITAALGDCTLVQYGPLAA